MNYGVNNIICRSHRKDCLLDTALSLDSINNFFHNVTVSTDHQPSSSFSQTKTTSCDSNFKFSSLSPSSVFYVLRKFDVKKFVGPDGFSATFLNEISAEFH